MITGEGLQSRDRNASPIQKKKTPCIYWYIYSFTYIHSVSVLYNGIVNDNMLN